MKPSQNVAQVESNVKEQKQMARILGEMPHNLEVEQALLGCMMLDAKIQVELAPIINEDDFYAETHKYVFNAIKNIVLLNKPADFVTISEELEKQGVLERAGGIEYLTTLADCVPSTANYRSYFDIVSTNSKLRKLMRGATEIIENCKTSNDKNASLAFAEKTVYDISDDSDTSEIVKISAVIPEVMNTLDELSKDKSASRGISTGYRGIDNILNGLHKSDLIILAARPAAGKTSFAMNIVDNVAKQGYSCAVFSLEMSKAQLGMRLLCSMAGVSMSHAMKGQMNKTEWLKIAKAREMLAESKIFIDDSAIITPQEMLSKCRRIKSKHGLDLVMVDYVQLMTSASKKSDNRQQEITEISRNLKILAKEINVPVIALSQLSRAVEKENRRPQLADLRESGAIEQDADIVMFIHRPDRTAKEKDIQDGKVKQNIAEIYIEKHRNGATGKVNLYFKGETTRFINLNENDEPEDDGSEEQSTPTVSSYQAYPTDGDVVKSVDDEIF